MALARASALEPGDADADVVAAVAQMVEAFQEFFGVVQEIGEQHYEAAARDAVCEFDF